MQILKQQNSLNFERLITGNSVKRKICGTNCPKQIINQFISHRKTIYKSGINKLNKVDIILEYCNNGGYFAQISSHDRGIINLKNAIFRGISNNIECINELKKWGEYWNHIFQ